MSISNSVYNGVYLELDVDRLDLDLIREFGPEEAARLVSVSLGMFRYPERVEIERVEASGTNFCDERSPN